MVLPSSASDSTVVFSAVPKPISLANILNKFKSSSGYNLFGVPCDSDTTVRYSSMSDDKNGPVGGMVQSSGLGSDRGRDGPSESDMQRQINALATHKEDIDISKYIRKLEVDLINLGCPRARWKSIMLQNLQSKSASANLQSKSASAIVASLDRADTDHAQLKDILIEALSSSLTSLGVKLTTDFASSTRSMSPLEMYVHLMDSVDMLCSSKEELLLFFACATYRASRPCAQGLNPLVPELFGRARKNLIVDRGTEHYRFIFLT